MFTRLLLAETLQALADVPAVALLGPRQVGKTTLAWAVADALRGRRDALYLDLESEADRAKMAHPELYLADHADKLVILDEVHRTPGLFAVLRGLIDQARRAAGGRADGRFLLLGSASVDLLAQASESLAGRIAYLEGRADGGPGPEHASARAPASAGMVFAYHAWPSGGDHAPGRPVWHPRQPACPLGGAGRAGARAGRPRRQPRRHPLRSTVAAGDRRAADAARLADDRRQSRETRGNCLPPTGRRASPTPLRRPTSPRRSAPGWPRCHPRSTWTLPGAGRSG